MWVPANFMLRVTMQWIRPVSHAEGVEIFLVVHATETEISSLADGLLGLFGDLTLIESLVKHFDVAKL